MTNHQRIIKKQGPLKPYTPEELMATKPNPNWVLENLFLRSVRKLYKKHLPPCPPELKP